MNVSEVADRLRFEWSPDGGFLYGLRYGRFDQTEAQRFLVALESIDVTDPARFDPRIVGRIWMVPYCMLSHIHNSAILGMDVREREKVMFRANDILARIFTGGVEVVE